jgi:hypothetical protein
MISQRICEAIFGDLLGEDVPANVAVDRLMSEYAESLADPDEEPVFWLALADTSWKLGRLEERVRDKAMHIIDEGPRPCALGVIAGSSKREAVLAKLRAQLVSSQPAARRIPKTQVHKRMGGWRGDRVSASFQSVGSNACDDFHGLTSYRLLNGFSIGTRRTALKPASLHNSRTFGSWRPTVPSPMPPFASEVVMQ